jgi:tetrahydromethanopterin S-methyltransferase subunit F
MCTACTNEKLREMMLDALKRGIKSARGEDSRSVAVSTIVLKKSICQNINMLQRDQKLQVLLAVARVAGIDAIGVHNNGCFVDITDWDDAMTKEIADVIQFASK